MSRATHPIDLGEMTRSLVAEAMNDPESIRGGYGRSAGQPLCVTADGVAVCMEIYRMGRRFRCVSGGFYVDAVINGTAHVSDHGTFLDYHDYDGFSMLYGCARLM